MSESILYVEDDERDVLLVKTVFRRAGITNPIHIVSDGQSAIDYLSGIGPFANREEHPLPSLVLLDLKLTRVCGFDVLQWIRQQPGLKNLVVVVFSSSSEPVDIQRAYELGVNSYVEKPMELERTLDLARYLKGWWLGHNQFPRLHATPAATEPHARGPIRRTAARQNNVLSEGSVG